MSSREALGGPAGIDEEDLARRIASALTGTPGGDPSPGRIRRRAFPGSTSYPAEILSIELATGGAIEIFLKDFTRSRIPKAGAAQRGERERRVYEELLDDADLGTPRYVGACWDEAAARFWLMLELVDGAPLAHCGFAHWLAAAAWLGRLHGRFANRRERLRACGFLLRHDADFFAGAAERALRAVSLLSDPLAQRLSEVLRGYDGVVDVLAREPETLVHGSFRPQNVLVAWSSGTPRICPTDWELAAFGRSTYDLAFLCDGFKGERLASLIGSYEREAERQGLARRDGRDLRREVDCVRLHKTVGSLGHLYLWKHPAETANEVVAAAEQIAGALA